MHSIAICLVFVHKLFQKRKLLKFIIIVKCSFNDCGKFLFFIPCSNCGKESHGIFWVGNKDDGFFKCFDEWWKRVWPSSKSKDFHRLRISEMHSINFQRFVSYSEKDNQLKSNIAEQKLSHSTIASQNRNQTNKTNTSISLNLFFIHTEKFPTKRASFTREQETPNFQNISISTTLFRSKPNKALCNENKMN